MKLKYHEDRSAVIQQRRIEAVEHMSARLNTLQQMRGHESSLNEMMDIGRRISFLTMVRDKTARNLDASLGGRPLDHMPKDDNHNLTTDTIDIFKREEPRFTSGPN